MFNNATNSQTSELATTNIGPFTAVGFQRFAGDKVFWMDCIMVKAAGSDSVQTAYEYCADRYGRQHRMDIPQVQDPTPLQLSARGNLERMQQLYTMWKLSKDRGCGLNMLVVQRDCIKPDQVNSPNFFKRAFWMYGMKATGRWTWGNDTIVGDNSKSPQLAEDQGQFIPSGVGVSMQYVYGQVNGSLPGGGFDEFVVVDSGSCGDAKCGVPVAGGQMIIGIKVGTTGCQLSIDGGKTFAATPVGVDPAHSIASKDNIVILTTRDATTQEVEFYVGVPNSGFTGITFTKATVLSGTPTDSKTTGNGTIGGSITDDAYGGMLWGGSGGQVFLSENYGSTWKRLANGVTVTTTVANVVNFYSLNRIGNKIYGVGRAGTSAQNVFVHSNDGGLNWVLDGYIAAVTVPTKVRQYAIGDVNYANVDGAIYRFDPTSISAALTPGGYANVNSLIPNPESPNDVLLLAQDGSLRRSMDGLASTNSEASQLGSLAAGLGASDLSSWAYVNTQYSSGILFSQGAGLYKVLESGSLFSS